MDTFKKNILNCLETKYVPHKGLRSLAENVAANLKFDAEETYKALCELEREGEIYEFNDLRSRGPLFGGAAFAEPVFPAGNSCCFPAEPGQNLAHCHRPN